MSTLPSALLWRCCALGTALLLAGLITPALAQIDTQNPLLGNLGNRVPRVSLPSDAVPLEGALDPAAYLVGPGDVFSFAIGGQLSYEQRATVSADGVLIVPGVGAFQVADRTLASVEAELQAALLRTYRNVTTNVALAVPRRFYVHVSGAVLDPGRHLVAPVARVEDALVTAMGGVSPQRLLDLTPARQALSVRALQATEAAALEPGSIQPRDALLPDTDYRPAFRNVLVTHRDGTQERVDLLRYYATGNTDANPYLRDGDAVYLPFYNPDTQSIGINGAVAEPGVYDYRPGDTALDILLIALGPDAQQRVGTVRLLRGERPSDLEAELITPGDLAATQLQPGDRIHVLPNERPAGTATAVGAVHFPSSYTIRPGETTLKSLLDMAGGLLPDALVRGAYLERRAPTRSGEAVLDVTQLAFDPTLSTELREAALAVAVFENTRLSTLDFAARQYLAREVLGFQRVSLDAEAALRDDAAPVYLRDGDRLVVPYDMNAIAVIGQVLRPGYLPFVDGQTADYYIAQAGGLGPGATDAHVVDIATGVYRSVEESGALQSGDLIFVNREAVADDRLTQQLVVQERQIAIQEERERNEARYRLLTVSVQAITAAVAVVGLLLRF